MQIKQQSIDIPTQTGVMRCYVYRPAREGKFPAIILYSEIFQHTAPIARSAATMACHGFVVLVPEVFHEFNLIGTVLGYNDAGKDKGNQDKLQKPLAAHDSDTSAIIDYCRKSAFCSGELGFMGVCLGGHLAYRATLNSKIKAAFCLSATDIHSNTLPAEKARQSLARMAEIEGEVHFVWGKQDPHVPHEGRLAIYNKLYSDGGFGVCINRSRGWSRDNK